MSDTVKVTQSGFASHAPHQISVVATMTSGLTVAGLS